MFFWVFYWHRKCIQNSKNVNEVILGHQVAEEKIRKMRFLFFYWSYDYETMCVRKVYVSAIPDNFFHVNRSVTGFSTSSQSWKTSVKVRLWRVHFHFLLLFIFCHQDFHGRFGSKAMMPAKLRALSRQWLKGWKTIQMIRRLKRKRVLPRNTAIRGGPYEGKQAML